MQTQFNDRILVVDDEEFCLSGLKVIMQCIGIDVANKVDFGMSGEEALQIIECAKQLGLRYQLVITDIQMPGINGIELTKKIRQQYRKSQEDAPEPMIVGVSGHV